MKQLLNKLKSFLFPTYISSDFEMDDNTKPVTPPLKEGREKKGGRNKPPKESRPKTTPSGQNPKKSRKKN